MDHGPLQRNGLTPPEPWEPDISEELNEAFHRKMWWEAYLMYAKDGFERDYAAECADKDIEEYKKKFDLK